MDPNYPMKTLNPNFEKVGISWSEGLSYTVLCFKGDYILRKYGIAKIVFSIFEIFEFSTSVQKYV